MEKVWKIEINSGKMVKSLEFFFFQIYNKCFCEFFPLVKCLSISPVAKTFNHIVRSFIILICDRIVPWLLRFAVHLKKRLVPAFFKVSIDHQFGNLGSGKISYCFGKSLEKVLNFGSEKSGFIFQRTN